MRKQLGLNCITEGLKLQVCILDAELNFSVYHNDVVSHEITFRKGEIQLN
jgi:hypothetical protein